MVVIWKQPTLLPTCATNILSLDLSSPFRWLPFIPIVSSGYALRASPSLVLGRWSFPRAHWCGDIITHNSHCPWLSLLDWKPREPKIVSDWVLDPRRTAQFLVHTFNKLCVWMNTWTLTLALKSSLKFLLKRYSTRYVQMDLTMKLCLNGCLPPNLWLNRVWGH